MQLQLKKKYVAFLDVLGFSALVNSDSKPKLEKYFEIVDGAFAIFDYEKKNIKKFSISDSIILIAEDNESDLKTLLTAIRTLQYSLAVNDIWLRGGISHGGVFIEEDKNIIVGKGYIKAFLLESEAIYPRVILDPSILKHLGLTRKELYDKFNGAPHEREDHLKLIHDYGVWNHERYTDDDAIFVSYANKIVVESVHTVRKPNMETNIETVYRHLRSNLYGPQQHYHKYLWLKKYFQESILDLINYIPIGAEDRNWLNELYSKYMNL